MKQKLVLIASLFAFMYGFVPYARCQWSATNGPYGEGQYVQCLFVIDSNLFAGTSCDGVYRSSDNGASWTPSSKGMPTCTFVKGFAVNGSLIFAGTANNGVFTSSNNGNSWEATNLGLMTNHIETIMSVGANIFVGTWDRGIFLTADNGGSWSAANNGLMSNDISCLSSNGVVLFAGTSDGGGQMNKGVFFSPDNGADWEPANAGFPVDHAVKCLAASGPNIIAGTWGGGVYVSSDNGMNWKVTNKGFHSADTIVLSIAVSGNKIFAGTYDGEVYLSTNRGANWSDVSNGLADNNINSLAVNGPFLFAADETHGVFGTIVNNLKGGRTVARTSKKTQKKIGNGSATISEQQKASTAASSNDKTIKLGGIVPCRVHVEDNVTYLYLKGTRTTVTKVSNGLTIFKEFDAALPTQPQISANQFDWTKELVGKEVTTEAGENIEPSCDGSSLVGESSCVWRYRTSDGSIAVSVTKKNSFGKDFQYIWENESFSDALEAEKERLLLK